MLADRSDSRITLDQQPHRPLQGLRPPGLLNLIGVTGPVWVRTETPRGRHAGMTAILVAVVGVLGTIMGAALTAFVAARTEQRRDAALERQQTWQEEAQNRTQLNELRVEHQRWRRERRQAAYLAFLEALGAADRDNQALFRELQAIHPPVSFDEERITAIRQKFKDAESAGLIVILEGPETVAAAAQSLVDQLSSLVQDVREYAETYATAGCDLAERSAAVHEVGMEFMAQRNEFLDIARNALDDVVKPERSQSDAR